MSVEGFLSYIYSVTEGEEKTTSQTVCAAQTPCPCACQVFEVFFLCSEKTILEQVDFRPGQHVVRATTWRAG